LVSGERRARARRAGAYKDVHDAILAWQLVYAVSSTNVEAVAGAGRAKLRSAATRGRYFMTTACLKVITSVRGRRS
jgi:hypothetical protein